MNPKKLSDSRSIFTVSLTLKGVYNRAMIQEGQRDSSEALNSLQNYLSEKSIGSKLESESISAELNGIPFGATFQQHGGNGSAKLILQVDSTSENDARKVRRLFKEYNAPYY